MFNPSNGKVTCVYNDSTWSPGRPYTLRLDFTNDPDGYESFHEAKVVYSENAIQTATGQVTKTKCLHWNMVKSIKTSANKKITVTLLAQDPQASAFSSVTGQGTGSAEALDQSNSVPERALSSSRSMPPSRRPERRRTWRSFRP